MKNWIFMLAFLSTTTQAALVQWDFVSANLYDHVTRQSVQITGNFVFDSEKHSLESMQIQSPWVEIQSTSASWPLDWELDPLVYERRSNNAGNIIRVNESGVVYNSSTWFQFMLGWDGAGTEFDYHSYLGWGSTYFFIHCWDDCGSDYEFEGKVRYTLEVHDVFISDLAPVAADVPEPTTLALLGLGLAGLGLSRRQKI